MADPAQYLQDLLRRIGGLTGAEPAPAPAATAQVPVVTQSAPTPVPAPPRPPTGGQTPPLLEQLRARVSQELASTNAAPQVDPRVVFGRGVLSNRGSFLDNLAAGVAAQETAETARRDAIRRNLEIERGITEAASREALERDRLAIERERRDIEGRRADAEIARGNRVTLTVIGTETGTGFAVVADPTAPGGTRVVQGVTPVQITNAANRAEAARDALAVRAGNAAVATAQRTSVTPLSEQQIESIFQDAYRRSLNPTQSGGGGGGGAGGPAARIDALGNPIR
jgi:hypothetical protein